MSEREAPKPSPESSRPAPATPTPEGGGSSSSLPREASASARVGAFLDQRAQAMDAVRYRASGGTQGTAPGGNIASERRAAATSAVARFMRKASGAPSGAPAIPQGGGSGLPSSTKSQMERRLGADLSGVKVHTGGESASAASQMGARAFTVGSDVHFNAGQFAPGTKEGDRLIAHELTHVVQGQRSGIQRKAEEESKEQEGEGGHEVSQPHEPAEKEADAVADGVADDLHADVKDDEKKDEKKKDKKSAKGDKGVEGKDEKGAKGEKADAGDEKKAAEEKPDAAISAKLDGVGRKVFRYAAEHQAYADEHERIFNEEKEKALPLAATATSLGGMQSVLGGLHPLLANNTSVAGLMIGKLQTAMTQAQAAWAEEDRVAATEGKPPKAAQKKTDFIDSRLAKVTSIAPGVIRNKINGATKEKPVDVKDVFWGIVSSDWSICAPEEEASEELLNEIGGVYKAFDAGEFYGKMEPGLKSKWEAAGGLAKWMEKVSSGQPLPVAPPGMEADPSVKPFVDGAKPAYPGTVSGFISTAKALDDPKVMGADKAGVIQLLALQPGRYPSAKMILSKMGAAGAGAQRTATAGAAKPARLGKPSMFYLIAFPENVYDATNRRVGVTAGGQPELQTTDMPAQAFLMDGTPMVKG